MSFYNPSSDENEHKKVMLLTNALTLALIRCTIDRNIKDIKSTMVNISSNSGRVSEALTLMQKIKEKTDKNMN